MNRWLLYFFLVGLSATPVMAGGEGDPVPPVTKHIEIAGTLVIDAGVLVLKSNGHQYLLTLESTEPGVASLKSGMALIVKGMLTLADGPGDEKTRTLRPDEMIIRGRTYHYIDAEPSSP